EENIDLLADTAGELGLLGLKGFFFQEGWDSRTEIAYREFARLTGGAYARFEPGAANQLRALLGAVATYAAGGQQELQKLGDRDGQAKLLLEQLK
ncbi:MAG: VWA domain-containing protein, partial [Pseudomonadota bacterium]